jgi:hypothetical protein
MPEYFQSLPLPIARPFIRPHIQDDERDRIPNRDDETSYLARRLPMVASHVTGTVQHLLHSHSFGADVPL